MYRHLLVPLDDSPLAVDTVHQAVTFAKTLGAKVTFFHAQADYGASSIGALERVMSPATFNEHMAGEARAILAKAEVVAQGGRRSPRLRHHDERPAARGHSARRRGARLRPDLHRLARPPWHQGTDARLADAEGPPADDNSGAGVGGRKQPAVTRRCSRRSRRSATSTARSPRSSMGSNSSPGKRAIRRRRRRFRCCARCSITSSRFPEKLHHPKEDAYLFRKLRERTSEFDATLDELERQHVDGHQLVERAGAEHRRLRGGSARRPARIRGGCRSVFDIADPAHGARSQGHHPGRARAPRPAKTGRRSARRSPRTAIRASRWTTTRSSASCSCESSILRRHRSQAHRPARLNNVAIRQLTWETQDHATPIDGSHLRAAAHRRRAAALAIAALFAASGAVQAFDIDTGNPDIQMRWDNTLRYNLGARAQSQDSKIIGSPNYDDGDRNFDKGSLVANRVDALSEFDFVYKRQIGFRVSGAGWYDNAYSHLDNTNTATANTLVNGLPVAGALSDYTKRYAKGVSGEILDAFGFVNFDVARRAGQHQGRPAHRVLGRQPAARRRDPRRVVRTESAQRLEGLCDSGKRSQGAVHASRRHYGAGAAAQGLVDRRAMVLQLAGRSHSGIGKLPDDSGSAQFRRRFVHLRTQSARCGHSRRAVLPAPLARRRTSSRRRTRAAWATGACRRAGAPTGSTARSASTTAMRPMSFLRRW